MNITIEIPIPNPDLQNKVLDYEGKLHYRLTYFNHHGITTVCDDEGKRQWVIREVNSNLRNFIYTFLKMRDVSFLSFEHTEEGCVLH